MEEFTKFTRGILRMDIHTRKWHGNDKEDNPCIVDHCCNVGQVLVFCDAVCRFSHHQNGSLCDQASSNSTSLWWQISSSFFQGHHLVVQDEDHQGQEEEQCARGMDWWRPKGNSLHLILPRCPHETPPTASSSSVSAILCKP